MQKLLFSESYSVKVEPVDGNNQIRWNFVNFLSLTRPLYKSFAGFAAKILIVSFKYLIIKAFSNHTLYCVVFCFRFFCSHFILCNLSLSLFFWNDRLCMSMLSSIFYRKVEPNVYEILVRIWDIAAFMAMNLIGLHTFKVFLSKVFYAAVSFGFLFNLVNEDLSKFAWVMLLPVLEKFRQWNSEWSWLYVRSATHV